MANRIQLRRGGAQEWANSNPTLAQGELGIELDTGRFKIGDGVTAWNSLRYERPVESTSNTANTLVQRDADGNFAAGTITSTLIGNASTASRLASTRQFQLADDVSATGVFDGSANLTLNTSLSLISTLPHYDGTATPTGTYTKVTVDAKGRITNASNPTTLAAYGLNGTVEGASAQPYDNDLIAIANLTTTGLLSRTSAGTMATRTITGTAARIQINDGGGLSGNPTIDLISTAVTAAAYNTASLTSVAGSQTVNTTTFTVDTYGRLTASVDAPIATAVEGTTAAAYNAGTTYSRDDKITNASKLYQAIGGISAGAGAPTHSDSSDSGSWRYLGAVTTQQKGLASFAQEDFDVSAAGHVSIASAAVDNTQLQNNKISFSDTNAKEDFALDSELTAATAYKGFNKLNYVKVNNTSGALLFSANNTGDGGAGEIDVNVRSYFSDPDITLDGGVAQTLAKTGDGNLTFTSTQNSSSARAVSLTATNSGSGSSTVNITAEDAVIITASEATNGKVTVEGSKFQADYIGSTGATLHLDPGDDRAVSGTCRIHGDLQVDGTTTTINSAVTTLDDPIITLGGDTAPSSDDNKDRGVEFRYYDSSARIGFFGYDDSAADLGGHTGSFSFLYNATNTSEVFSGTDAGIIAGNLKLTTGTASTTNTTGDLVVAGGVGITGAVNIGGSVDIDTNLGVTGTSLFTDEVVIKGASKNFILKDGSNNAKITAVTTSGNLTMEGILAVTGNVNVNSNKFNITASSGNTAIAGVTTISNDTIIKADNKFFKVQTAAGADKFTIDTDNGDANGEGKLNVADLVHFESTDEPNIALNGGTDLYEIQSSDYGALRNDGGGYFAKDVLFNGDLYLNGDFNQRDSGTESWGLRNWLQVRYKVRAGSSVAYTPTYATHNTSNLRVYGGGGVATNWHVGGTGSGEGLFVGKKNSGDTVKFSVLGATGNITSEGVLTQNGNAEFNGTVDVDGNFAVRNSTTDKFTVASSTGNAVGEGDLNIKGAVDFDTTLNVDGATTIQDDLIVKSDNKLFKVQTAGAVDKFTVDTDNGNTAIAGTLVVQGETQVIDTLKVNAANETFTIQNGAGSPVTKFEVDTDNGNTNIIGTLTVGDATQINDTFGVSGVITATANTEQTLTGSYAADGAGRFSGGIGLAKNLAVGGGARVYGNTELTGSLDLNSSADISGNLVVSNADEATSLADASVALQVAGGATIDKNTYVGGNFVVYDAGNTRAAFTVTNATGDGEFHNDLTVGGDLVVNGNTTTVNSTVTTLDDPIITLGGDTAPSSNDAKDRGVEFRYYDSSAKIGFFGLDRSTLEFCMLTGGTNTAEVMAGTDGALRIGSVHVTGAGTSLDVDNNLNVDGTATVDGQIISQVGSGPALVIPTTDKINNLNADLLDGMTTATANTVSTVVNRDSSGNFAAGTITAALTGNASTATTLATARNIAVAGAVSGTVSFNGSADVSITTAFVDADITALAGMSGTGYVVRTAANTYAQRTFAVTANSGVTLTNADGVSGATTINVASASSNSASNLVLRDGSGNFAAGTITAALTGNVTGNLTGTADVATTVTVADESTDTSCNVLFATAATGNLAPKSGTNLTFNSNTGILTATGFAGDITGDLTGNADTCTTATRVQIWANNSTDATHYLVFADAATGSETIDSDTGLTYNPSSGIITATQFTGAVVGNVTGNVTGTASNATLAADATKLATARTIGGTSFDGSANIAVGLAATATALATARTIGGTSFDGTANITPATATQAANLSNHNTAALSEGTNLYYTEARVQAKLDNAYAQLSAMLNNLATATTLVLNLSGDPTPGSVVTLGAITNNGVGGFSNGTGVATTGGTGSGLTVNTTTSGGVITAIALNAAGSDYLVGDTLTIANAAAGGVKTVNGATLTAGTGYASGTNIAATGGDGSSLTVDITASSGGITGVTVNTAGTGYAAGNTVTIANANASGVKTLGTISAAGATYINATAVATTSSGSGTGLTVDITTNAGAVTAVSINNDGSGYAASEVITITGGNGAATIPVSAIHGNGATIDVATVFVNATFALSDITTMEVGATVTGSTSGSTAVITALGATSVTVDNVDGFFKVGETVGANDVTNLTISSFA